MFIPFSINSFMVVSWAFWVAYLLQYESIAERKNAYYFHSPVPVPMGVVRQPLSSEGVIEEMDEKDIQSTICGDEEAGPFRVAVSAN